MFDINGEKRSEETFTAFFILPSYFPSTHDKIKTAEFLDASTSTITLIEKFGKVFSPVTYDMKGNIKKLTIKYEEDKITQKYLEDMILKEQNEGALVATDALQWLKRALHFLSCFFQAIIDDTGNGSQDLTPFIKQAYSDTLEPHHGWLGTQLFNVLSRFVPSRRHLMYTLSLEQLDREEYVIHDMKVFTQRMMDCVRRISDFYSQNNLEPTLVT